MTNNGFAFAGPKKAPLTSKSLTIIEAIGMTPIRCHPGEVLREDFRIPTGISARKLAETIGVPPSRISDIVRERRNITADTAIRLGRYLGTDGRFWMNLRLSHDLSKAEADNDYSNIRTRTA